MNAPTKFQTILDADGKPLFVIVPYDEFQRMRADAGSGLVPNAVVNRVFDAGISPMAAWREYLRLTQSEVAQRMGITQSAYAQAEAGKQPRKATLEKAATAMGLTLDQLRW